MLVVQLKSYKSQLQVKYVETKFNEGEINS